jgi:hypothetical protein
MNDDSLDRPEAVRENARLDLDKLATWLAAHDLPGAVEVLQFPRGYSNLTYLLRVSPEGGAPREIVLRRPPFGVKIASAHDMGREHRILSGLAKVWDKVPATIGHEARRERARRALLRDGAGARGDPPRQVAEGVELSSLDGRAHEARSEKCSSTRSSGDPRRST